MHKRSASTHRLTLNLRFGILEVSLTSMSHIFIQYGPTTTVSGSTPNSKQMTRYCRYMCLAIASKNAMGTRHITFTSMLNRMMPNHLVKDSRNGIHFFGRPAPDCLLRCFIHTSPD